MLLRPVFDANGGVTYEPTEEDEPVDPQPRAQSPAYTPPMPGHMNVSILDVSREHVMAYPHVREPSPVFPTPVYLPPPPPARAFSLSGGGFGSEYQEATVEHPILPGLPPRGLTPVGEEMTLPVAVGAVVPGYGTPWGWDGDDEFFRNVVGHVVANDDDEGIEPATEAGREYLGAPRVRHPLEGSGVQLDSRTERKYRKNRPIEPYGLPWRSLAHVMPHLSPLYLAVDLESGERHHIQVVEEFCFSEIQSRLAVYNRSQRSWMKLMAKIAPFHHHIISRVKAQRKEAKRRARTMAHMVNQHYNPTMVDIEAEVHGQIAGLQALRMQWAAEMDMG